MSREIERRPVVVNVRLKPDADMNEFLRQIRPLDADKISAYNRRRLAIVQCHPDLVAKIAALSTVESAVEDQRVLITDATA